MHWNLLGLTERARYNRRMKRIALLVVGLLLVYAVGQYAMNHSTAWTPETKASVWVAVGTLLLAIATAWSVWETRLVIRGEDRRHQQSFAPSVRLIGPQGYGNSNRFWYVIKNKGFGLANDVSVSLNAGGVFNDQVVARLEGRPV
jgi:hypothetical protein